MAARSKRNQERFHDPRAGGRQMYKALKKPLGKPLVFVMQDDGQQTADPEVVDRKAREAWEKVYRGMPGQQEELVESFFQIYSEDMPPRQEPGLNSKITGGGRALRVLEDGRHLGRP